MDCPKRLRLIPWIIDRLNERRYPSLQWHDKQKMIFRLAWPHKSAHDWKEESIYYYEDWAKCKGKLNLGEVPDHKKLKSNFRCALNSKRELHEIIGLRTKKYRYWQILGTPKRSKKAKKVKGKVYNKKFKTKKVKLLKKVYKVKMLTHENIIKDHLDKNEVTKRDYLKQEQSYDDCCNASQVNVFPNVHESKETPPFNNVNLKIEDLELLQHILGNSIVSSECTMTSLNDNFMNSTNISSLNQRLDNNDIINNDTDSSYITNFHPTSDTSNSDTSLSSIMNEINYEILLVNDNELQSILCM